MNKRSIKYTWMFPKIVVPPKSSITIGFSIINHPFWGTAIFGNTHMGKFSPQILWSEGEGSINSQASPLRWKAGRDVDIRWILCMHLQRLGFQMLKNESLFFSGVGSVFSKPFKDVFFGKVGAATEVFETLQVVYCMQFDLCLETLNTQTPEAGEDKRMSKKRGWKQA